jgi:excisionase family DNA binding protein
VSEELAKALRDCLVSPMRGENATDALYEIADALRNVAKEMSRLRMELPAMLNPPKQEVATVDADKVMTLQQAAEAMGLSVHTVKRYAKDGRIKVVRRSKHRLGVTETEVNEFLREMRA